jgi:hypothetical protein
MNLAFFINPLLVKTGNCKKAAGVNLGKKVNMATSQ